MRYILVAVCAVQLCVAITADEICDGFKGWFPVHSGLDLHDGFDCLSLSNKSDVASCLLQANGVTRIMNCVAPYADDLNYFELEDWNDPADMMDIFAGEDQSEPDKDRSMSFTVRGILEAALLACAEETSSERPVCYKPMLTAIRDCPRENDEVFLNCLCCSELTPGDIAQLDDWVNSMKFGSRNYTTRSHQPFEFKCCNTVCKYLDANETQIDCPEDLEMPLKREESDLFSDGISLSKAPRQTFTMETKPPKRTFTPPTIAAPSKKTIAEDVPLVKESAAAKPSTRSPPGLSKGAKAGIGIGVGVAALLLIGGAYACWRRRGYHRVAKEEEYETKTVEITIPSKSLM